MRQGHKPTRPVPRRLIAAVALVAVSFVALGAGACGGEDTSSGPAGTSQGSDKTPSGYTVVPTPVVANVSLPRADGSGDLMMAAPPGGLRLVYFGYTSCPDVCPTTLSDLRRAVASLPAADRDRVDVAMVTIDPARDTAEKLSKYLHVFFPNGDALRTDDQNQLKAATSPFGAQYSVKLNDKGEEEVSHTAEVYAVNDKGEIVMQWPFGTAWKDIGTDVRSLLAKTSKASNASGASNQ